VPVQARPTPTQTLQAENERLRKAIEVECQLWRAAEARLQQPTRATPASSHFQPEDRPEGLQQSRHGPTTAQEDNRYVQRTPQVQLPQQHAPQGFVQPQYAPVTEDVGPEQPAVRQDYQTNLIEALTRFQMTFAEDRRRTDDQISSLQHLTARGQKSTRLKAADVRYFEPKGMPNSEAAMTFIENFKDAVIHYGDTNTLAVL
jgi:hypothetical protein